MLYIFYVDIGKSLSFDMNLVNESVEHLKHVIEEYYNIPVCKQVLLISGGDSLKDEVRVCSYSAGTDTNPIYLFNRVFLERSELPCVNPDFRYSSSIDAELNQLYESIENLSAPVSIYTINKINQLAQKYLEQATETKIFCDQLNADQLLQQQGFAAAIANLDDVLIDFKMKCEVFDTLYTKYLETRQENSDLINRFSEDLNLLSRIPLLPALLDGNEEERDRLETCFQNTNISDISLLQWISAKEPGQSLENVVMTCRSALEKYDEHALVTLKSDINNMFHPDKVSELRNNVDVSKKLMSLSGLVVTISNTYEDQAKKASGIKRNHDRASDLKDDSILPDLVVTHRDTLKSMKANHTNLRSCRQLCMQAKTDLCEMFHNRLKTVMMIQERISEILSMLVLHSGNMKTIRDYIDLIQQLHSTPKNYFAAVSEVVRRRSYSQAFLMWASDLACRIFSIYTEETERRKKFLAQFEGHFLNCLFPGLDDIPPPFATQSPPLFDNNLPALCEDDLKQLCQNLPDLGGCIQAPDVDAIRNFFLSKSITLSEVDSHDDNVLKANPLVDDKLAVGMSAAAGINEHFSHNRSETQKNGDIQKSADIMFSANSSIRAIESCDQSDENKHQKELKTMQEGMAILGTVAHNTVILLRNDLSALRNWVVSHQSEIVNIIQRLYSQSQQQQSHIKNLVELVTEKEDKIKSLYLKISTLETEHLEDINEDEKIEKRIKDERERIIKDVTEQLNRDHKKEMDILRQRFRLMTCTNMERTPSDSSLEKIERGELIELANHETVVNQLKQDMEAHLNKAIVDEREFWKTKLEQEFKKLNLKYETEKQMLSETMERSLMEQFEKQMETMRIRETSLLSELQRHKETIHTLTNPEGSSYSLLNRIEELERQKNNLEAELVKERHLKYAYNSATSQLNVLSYTTDSGGSTTSLTSNNSSPELQQNRSRFKEKIAYKKNTRGSTSVLQGVLVCLQTCNVGDTVLVVWDDAQRNYTILQNSSTLHFLHPSSVEQLGLRPPSDGSPKKLLCPAEVIEKEYCASKKTVNRYNLKEGEKFYRVKVKPKDT